MVWNVQRNVRVDCAGTSCADGELTSVAAAVPESVGAHDTLSAFASPTFITSVRSVRFCPVLTCSRSSVALASRNAAVFTATAFDVAVGTWRAAPLFWSLPEADTEKSTVAAVSIA